MIHFERIKELAKKQYMPLTEVNDKAKLGTRSIYNWKTSVPPADKLKRVAVVLHTTTDYLMGKTDDPSLPTEKEKSHDITWQDLGMAYGGTIPEDLKGYYRAMAEQYVKEHPDSIEKD